jgi:hypothetical protein
MLLCFAVIAALFTVTAFAGGGWRVTNAKIPFAFRAGKITMPAGNYEVESPWNTAAPIVTLRNMDTGDTTSFVAPLTVAPKNDDSGSTAYLEFLCAGKDCAFHQVWPDGYRNGYAVSRPKVGTEIGRNGAPGEIQVARVLVPLRASQ